MIEHWINIWARSGRETRYSPELHTSEKDAVEEIVEGHLEYAYDHTLYSFQGPTGRHVEFMDLTPHAEEIALAERREALFDYTDKMSMGAPK